MRHGNSFLNFRYFINRNGVKLAILAVMMMVIGVIDVSQILAQSQPSAEIFVDTSNVNYPLRLTIATNTRKDVASITIKASEPTKVVAFKGDTNKVILYPIGEAGMGIYSVPDTTFLPTGSNITIARFMTDNSTRQQKFTVDFLNRNGESVTSQTINVGIAASVTLAPPCNRQVLDFSTGKGIFPPWMPAYPPWSQGGNPLVGYDPNWTVSVFPYSSSTATSAFSAFNNNTPGSENHGAYWLRPGDDGRKYAYRRYFCANSSGSAILQFSALVDGTASISVNGASPHTINAPFWPPFIYHTFNENIVAGSNYIEVVFQDTPNNPAGFILSDATIQTPTGVLGLSSDACCFPKGRLFGWKYWDKNCNGIKDNGDEPLLSGWVITATPTAGGTPTTAITDGGSGFYQMFLTEGTYIVTETPQNGWSPSVSAGPYTVPIKSGKDENRDFLNCKQPTCEELFTLQNSDSVCCTGRFAISNAGNVVVTQLSFSATGGIVTGVNTGCMATTSPNLTSGLTSGTFTFNPGCANMSVQFDARSTTATGKICVLWTATFKQGTQTFTCSKSICINCIRMPKECGNPLQVTPYVFGDLNTDWRTFKLSNVKLPMSSISSVDIVLVNPPTPTHIGGGLNVDGQLRTWTFGNSTGYSKIRLNCGGGVTTAFPMGASGSNFVQFNLGIDNTINYNGIVKLKIAYCDGDTCDVDYQWTTKTRQTLNTNIDTARMYANPRMIRMKVKAPDSTRSIAFRIGDSTTTIRAITPPCGNPELDCPDIPKQFKVAAKGNSTIMTFGDGACNPDPYCYCCPPDQFTVNIAFSTAVKGDDLIRVRVIYYDQSGAEIGSSERELRSTITGINHDIDGSGIGNEIMIKGIVPNPVNESATLRFSVNESARSVTVTIVDLQGRLLKTLLDNQRIDAGEQILPFNTSSLSAGVYVVKVSADGMNNTIKLNIVR